MTIEWSGNNLSIESYEAAPLRIHMTFIFEGSAFRWAFKQHYNCNEIHLMNTFAQWGHKVKRVRVVEVKDEFDWRRH